MLKNGRRVQLEGKKGLNPGGLFQAPDCSQWYCRFPADENVAKSEVPPSKLYCAPGRPAEEVSGCGRR
ncbi:hypothetical protein [Geminicoccus flavidas]|uniref:hypothetical protein n=1 Tax=Geminicoccus flavidas TaxID=2506407 RepID=UPI00135BEA5F|nr:hypothetical protein [Geminicoccus flavidas]